MIMLDSLHKSRGNLSQLQHTQKSTKSKQKIGDIAQNTGM